MSYLLFFLIYAPEVSHLHFKTDKLSAVSLDTEINTIILNEIRQVSKFTILLENKMYFFPVSS